MAKLLFKDSNSVSDVANVIINYVASHNMPSKKIFEQNYFALVSLDKQKQEKFMNYVHYVDMLFHEKSSNNMYYPAVNAILAGATYYYDYFDKIKDYTDGELSILANYSTMSYVYEYQEILDKFPKDILKIIENRTNEFSKRDDMLVWYDFSLDQGKDYSYLKEQLEKKPLDDISMEAMKLSDENLEEDTKHDSRRI